MKKSKGGIIALISIFSLLAVLLVSLMIWLMTGNRHFFKGFTFGFGSHISTKIVLDEVYDNTFQYIDLDMEFGDIYLKQSLDDKVHVKVYSDDDKMASSISPERLSISFAEEKSHFFNFSFARVRSKIEVYLPKEYQNHIELTNNYGDIETDTFSETKFQVEADCGDVSIRGAQTIDIENRYGDITLGTVKVAKVVADCGDVVISNVGELIAENSYGDITVDVVDDFLKIKADCGDVFLTSVTLGKNSSIENSYGDVSIKDIANVYVEAKTHLGEANIAKNHRRAEVILKIENDCGDIDVG